MRDDFETAEWAEGRRHFHGFITNMIDKVSYLFERLVAIEYDAPWRNVRP